MVTLFTLYYLDTRTNHEEPMPDWMVLFGAVPLFRLPENQLPDVGNWEWGTSNCRISGGRGNVTGNPLWERATPLATLYRIQGHCQHVLECLKCRDGYQRVSACLSSYA